MMGRLLIFQVHVDLDLDLESTTLDLIAYRTRRQISRWKSLVGWQGWNEWIDLDLDLDLQSGPAL